MVTKIDIDAEIKNLLTQNMRMAAHIMAGVGFLADAFTENAYSDKSKYLNFIALTTFLISLEKDGSITINTKSMNEEALKRCEEDRDRKAAEVATDLHEVAGLVLWGKDENGDLEWVGTKKQWDKYQELVELDEKGIDF